MATSAFADVARHEVEQLQHQVGARRGTDKQAVVEQFLSAAANPRTRHGFAQRMAAAAAHLDACNEIDGGLPTNHLAELADALNSPQLSDEEQQAESRRKASSLDEASAAANAMDFAVGKGARTEKLWVQSTAGPDGQPNPWRMAKLATHMRAGGANDTAIGLAVAYRLASDANDNIDAGVARLDGILALPPGRQRQMPSSWVDLLAGSSERLGVVQAFASRRRIRASVEAKLHSEYADNADVAGQSIAALTFLKTSVIPDGRLEPLRTDLARLISTKDFAGFRTKMVDFVLNNRDAVTDLTAQDFAPDPADIERLAAIDAAKAASQDEISTFARNGGTYFDPVNNRVICVDRADQTRILADVFEPTIQIVADTRRPGFEQAVITGPASRDSFGTRSVYVRVAKGQLYDVSKDDDRRSVDPVKLLARMVDHELVAPDAMERAEATVSERNTAAELAREQARLAAGVAKDQAERLHAEAVGLEQGVAEDFRSRYGGVVLGRSQLGHAPTALVVLPDYEIDTEATQTVLLAAHPSRPISPADFDTWVQASAHGINAALEDGSMRVLADAKPCPVEPFSWGRRLLRFTDPADRETYQVASRQYRADINREEKAAARIALEQFTGHVVAVNIEDGRSFVAYVIPDADKKTFRNLSVSTPRPDDGTAPRLQLGSPAYGNVFVNVEGNEGGVRADGRLFASDQVTVHDLGPLSAAENGHPDWSRWAPAIKDALLTTPTPEVAVESAPLL